MSDMKKIFDIAVTKFESMDERGLVRGVASAEQSDSVNDVILASAWEKALNEKASRSVLMLNQHSAIDGPIGHWRKLWVEGGELHVEGQLNLDVQKAREIHSMLQRDITSYGLSVCFSLPSNGFRKLKNGGREIHTLKLREISFVTFPCLEQARLVSVSKNWSDSIRDFEHTLHKLGASRNQAKLFATGGYRLAKGGGDDAAHILADTLCRLDTLR